MKKIEGEEGGEKNTMKTMTCRQMGGPCDMAMHGATADEMMAAGGAHVREMAAKGDEAHKKVEAMMDAMQNDPKSDEEWMKKFQADFAALPEDAQS